MTHSYIAYIDESGDDGLKKFSSETSNGSTHWLIISCCVARYINDLDFIALRDSIKSSQKEEIHFRDLTHAQKVMACQRIAKFPLRAFSVMSNKTTIEKGVYTEKNQLYHYVTRHLIERISWLCRDLRPRVPEGDGRVKIIFSRKKGMNYPHFQNYLRSLQDKKDENIKIHWPVTDIDAVEAQDHSRRAGLQIANCIATAFREAVDPNRYGNTESRYAKEFFDQFLYNKK